MSSFSTIDHVPQKVRVAQRVGAELTDLLEFDASISENHSSELELTDHPIEVGADVTDHMRLRPNTFAMSAIISNRPIVKDASTSPGIRGGSPLERAEDAYREMLRWQSDGLLLTVITTLRTYENTVLQSISPTRDASTGQILQAQLVFREILTAETRLVDVPDTERPQDNKRRDKGKKTKKEAKPETEAAATGQTSTAANFVNRLFGA